MTTIVIGGGASGLVGAISAASINNEVIILERNNSCGKKILVTGNGHCNYFHENITVNNYHSEYQHLEELITKENIDKTLQFLNNLGIVPKIKNDYYYPYSNQAVSVLNMLMNELDNKGVKVFYNTIVTDLKKVSNTFIVTTNNGEYQADNVIVSVGGSAYPKSGSDGNFYCVLEKLGHKIIKPLPALVGLTVKENIKDLKGIRSDVELILFENCREIKKEVGELQHNENGISGICVMQLSSLVVRGLEQNKKEEIHINYVKNIAKDKEEFYTFLKKQKNKKISLILDQVLNYKLTNYFLKSLKINDVNLNEIAKDKLLSLCEMITNFKLSINGNNGFSEAQVTSGGVSLNDVKLSTLESKHLDNLYFCGEILDVDGMCGGYNLAFAFLSGMIVGNSIRGKKNAKN